MTSAVESRAVEARQTRESNADRLRALMARHGLDPASPRHQAAIAAVARVSPLTVKSWLRNLESAAWRPMPDAALELLWFKLEDRSCFTDRAAGPRGSGTE